MLESARCQICDLDPSCQVARCIATGVQRTF
jgi:hypothetical protein